MSEVYYPDPNSDSPRSAVRLEIITTTNTSPLEIETNSAHNYETGDQVEIIGTQDPAAEGLWNITVTQPTKFTLIGSTGTLNGGAQGYVKNFTVLPNGTYLEDGVDLLDATNINTPVENVNNFVPFGYRLAGQYRLFETRFVQATDEAWAAWSTDAPGIFNAAAWAVTAGGANLFGGGEYYVDETDAFEIWMTLTVDTTGGGVGLAALALGLKLGAATARIAGSAQKLLPATAELQVCLHANTGSIITGAGNVTYDISVMGYGNVGAPQHVALKGYYTLTLHHLKNNEI